MSSTETVQTKPRYVFKYSYNVQYGIHQFEKAYKIITETSDHVLVQHWYGKRWHPKNSAWRIEKCAE